MTRKTQACAVLRSLSLGLFVVLSGACGNENETGNNKGSGGDDASGGSGAVTGGALPSTGGNPSTGGQSLTGGGGSTTGGAIPTGGTPSAGGAPTGGILSTGGVPTGGDSATGGNPSSGGAPPTGGASPSGGAATGGSELTGGQPSTGGAPTGGRPPTVVIGPERTGEGTYYNGSGVVNCSYEGITDDMLIAALNSTDYGTADWCGACAHVQGPDGEVTVQVVDNCPSCAEGDLDFSPTAFAQIAEMSAGRVPITWTFVSCDLTGPVTYRYKDGSNPGWTEVIVENHRLPIVSLEWSKDQATWTLMERQTYNFFVETSGFGGGNTYVRLTAVDGQQLIDVLPPVQEYLVTEGATNFQ